MKERLVLIGGGGHCKSCIDVIEAEGRFRIAGIVDLKENVGKKVLGYEVIGCDDDLPKLRRECENFFVTVGQIKSPLKRIDLFETLKRLKANIPVIASPSAQLSRHAGIDEGTIIMHGAFVNADARIGKNCIINTNAVIEHDAVIGSHCHISTGAIINGGTFIGRNSFIGSNTMVRECVEIGEDSVIGGGLSILKDLPANSFLKGGNDA